MGEGEAEAGEIALPRKYSLGRVRRIPAGSLRQITEIFRVLSIHLLPSTPPPSSPTLTSIVLPPLTRGSYILAFFVLFRAVSPEVEPRPRHRLRPNFVQVVRCC